MKTTLIIAATILGVGNAAAQKMNEKDVPAAVVKSFKDKYPGAKAEKWEKEDGNFEAEFDWNKVESAASFDASGKFLEYENEIKTSELPKAVMDFCAANYKDCKVTEASKITDASGKVMYEAEISKGKEEMDLIFDEQGHFLKKELDKEKDDDDKK